MFSGIPGSWLGKNKRGYLLDFQMPDSADQMPIGQEANLRSVNPEKIILDLSGAGVNVLYVHAKDNQGNCYYNTKFGHKHTGLGQRDLMKEFSNNARKHNISILYYVQLSRERRGTEYETYAGRTEQGEVVNRKVSGPMLPARDEFPAMCLNGPGRDYQINCLKELSEKYDFDGFWLDNPNSWMSLNPCYCDTCREKYLIETGLDLPTSKEIRKNTNSYKLFIEYKRRQNTIIIRELIEEIKSVNPNLTVTHNGSALKWFHGADFIDFDDYVTNEFHYDEGYGYLSYLCRVLSSLKRNVPFEVEVWRFFNRLAEKGMVRGYEVRPVAQIYTEVATILANGGFPQYYDQINPDGSLNNLSLFHLKDVYKKVEQLEQFLPEDDKRISYASIVWSKETDAYFHSAAGIDHEKERMGFHFALLEQHVLYEFLTDRDINDGNFINSQVVVLPDVVSLSEQGAANLREYVRAGGGVVASNRTSLSDPSGNRRQDFLLGDLFGCEYVEPFSYTYGFRRFDEESPLTKNVPISWPMTIWNKNMIKVRVINNGVPMGKMMNPMRGMMMGHPPQEETNWPAAVMQNYGKGRVIYLPYQAGAAYADYGHPHQRSLIVNAVMWAGRKQQIIEVNAPETVEVVLWEGKNQSLMLHVINRTAGGPHRTKGSVITNPIVVSNIKLKLAGKYSIAVWHPDNVHINIDQKDDFSLVELPPIEIYGILELKK